MTRIEGIPRAARESVARGAPWLNIIGDKNGGAIAEAASMSIEEGIAIVPHRENTDPAGKIDGVNALFDMANMTIHAP